MQGTDEPATVDVDQGMCQTGSVSLLMVESPVSVSLRLWLEARHQCCHSVLR